MARLISVHEYELKPGTDPERFEQTLHDAEAQGLFDLPGLISHHFVKGVKGARRDALRGDVGLRKPGCLGTIVGHPGASEDACRVS